MKQHWIGTRGLLVGTVSVRAAGGSSLKTSPPNIVFIEVDDLTYSYLGRFGSRVARTPNIDALARMRLCCSTTAATRTIWWISPRLTRMS